MKFTVCSALHMLWEDMAFCTSREPLSRAIITKWMELDSVDSIYNNQQKILFPLSRMNL